MRTTNRKPPGGQKKPQRKRKKSSLCTAQTLNPKTLDLGQVDTTAPNTDKLSLNTALSPGDKLHSPDRLLAEALSSVAARSEGVSDDQLIRTMTKVMSLSFQSDDVLIRTMNEVMSL